MAKKLSIEQYYDFKRKDWWDHNVDFKTAQKQHKNNILKLKTIAEWREDKNRPISISVIHGSGRHTTESCAHEMSNSQMLLERSIALAQEEWQGRKFEVDRHVLREYILDLCNGCYSTASALCQFSCTCFPADDITTKIYPSIMKADIILWSTPVNQSMVSSRIKLVLDRLISLDGGYFVEDLPVKNDEYKQQAMWLSQNKKVEYDPRMFGKIAGYFVTTKDLENPLEESAPYPKEFLRLGYKDFVVGAIAHQGAEYGWFHADPFYAVSAAKHDEEMSFDKSRHDEDLAAHKEGKKVVLASLEMAEKFIEEPPKLTNKGRVNRT